MCHPLVTTLPDALQGACPGQGVDQGIMASRLPVMVVVVMMVVTVMMMMMVMVPPPAMMMVMMVMVPPPATMVVMVSDELNGGVLLFHRRPRRVSRLGSLQ
jgi:hypothetical protein